MNRKKVTPGWWYLKVDYEPYYCIVHVVECTLGPEVGILWVFLSDQEGPSYVDDFSEDQFIRKVPSPDSLLDDVENRILDVFLEELSDHMGNAGCNDFTWPHYVSDEKKLQILTDYHKWNGDYEEIAHTFERFQEYAKNDYTVDFIILKYLRNKLISRDK